MRRPWSQEPNLIMKTLHSFVGKGLPVTLQLRNYGTLRTRLLRIYYHREWPYLLIYKPNSLENSQYLQSLLFKMKGFPVLGFPCRIERESESLLAVRFPDTMFQLELRENGRIEPLPGSMATFFIKNRERVSICTLENVSMTGVKLVGRPTHHIREKDIIGPCTLSLAGRDALISREVTVNKSHVVRIAEEDGHSAQFGLGLRFDLLENEKTQLKEHIAYLGKM